MYNTYWIFDEGKFDVVNNVFTEPFRKKCKRLILQGDTDQRCHMDKFSTQIIRNLPSYHRDVSYYIVSRYSKTKQNF